MENPESMNNPEYMERPENTEESRKGARLPYILGGAPGALVAFSGMEAFGSVLTCLLYLIAVLAAGGLGNIMTLCLSIAGMVLAFKLWIGLRKLHKGKYEGADTAAEAVTGRRVLLWVGFAILMISYIIGLAGAGAGGAGLIAFIIAALVCLLFLLPINFYYKKAGEILGHAKYESASENPIRPEKVGSFSVWSIIFAALLLFWVLLEMFGPYIFEKFDDSNLFNALNSVMAYDAINRYRSLILLILYIAAGRFLVNNICFRGFIRSHRTGGGESLGPTGLENSYGICVLGSILFGWISLSTLKSWLGNADYVHKYGKYFVEGDQLYYSRIMNFEVFLIIAAVLFAVTLMLRKCRTIPGILGSAAMIASCVFNLLIYSAGPNASETVKEKYSMLNVADYLTIAFCAIVVIALLVRLVRRVPRAVPVFLMVLAVVAGILIIAAKWPKADKSDFSVEQLLTIISNLVFYGGVKTFAMFGMAWLVRTRRDSDRLQQDPGSGMVSEQ